MKDLKEKLALHKEWLLGNNKGIILDLRDANLRDANLRDANLSGENLSGENIRYVNIRYVNLRDANLIRCIGNNREVKSLQIGVYLVSYTKDVLNIGYQSHKHIDWRTFSDSIILDMDVAQALDWWNLNNHIIFELIDREGLNNVR